MPDKGWIKLHRKITECGIWRDKPYDRAHAWVDILLMANHEGKKFLLGNEMVQVERGSFVTSIRKLSQRWDWSNTKVNNFLKLLESEQMAEIKSDTKKTVLTIVNYGSYQDYQNTEETQERHDSDTTATRQHTNKNDKNVKNDKKINISSKVFADDSIELKLASELFNFIRQNNSNAKEPNIQSWAKDFDLILRVDKRELADVRKVMEWSQKDQFWKGNILSPGTLRKQFDKLTVQMQSRGGQAKAPNFGADRTPKKDSKYEQFYL